MTKNSRRKIVCLADDLTGASVTASLLREAGLPRVSVIDTTSLDCACAGGDAVVVNLDNRDLEESPAIEVLTRSITELLQNDSNHEVRWSIRVDSTLRGHVGATLAAIRSVLNPGSLLVAPAFPTAGRLTVNGVQLMPAEVASRGQFLSKELDLVRILKSAGYETQLLNGSVEQMISTTGPGVRAVVGDASSQRDLALLAKDLLPLWTHDTVVVDSGPFLAALVREERGRQAKVEVAPVAGGNSLPTLIVVGSRATTTRRQLDYLYSTELRIIHLDANGDDAEVCLNAQELRNADVLVITSTNEAGSIDIELGRVAGLAKRIISLLGGTPPMIVSGGRTASVLFEKLDVHVLEAGGELLPLIPLSTIRQGQLDGSLVVTKGGLVGNDDTLLSVLKVIAVLREGMTG